MRAARAATAVGALQDLKVARERVKKATQVQQSQKGRRRDATMRIKIISMGVAGVGKSCLIKRYCEEKFVGKYISTIGVDYGVKSDLSYVKKVSKDNPVNIGNQKDVRVNLWDLAGGEEYFEVRNEFYKDAQGCMLVYDVNNRASFSALEAWIEESAKYGATNAVVVVAANKTDIGRRAVSEQEGRTWAEANGFLFFEVSAAHGDRVRAMFAAMFHRVLENIPGTSEDVLSGASALVSTEYEKSASDGHDCHYDVGKTRLRSGLRAGGCS